jgi:hypothetical protein
MAPPQNKSVKKKKAPTYDRGAEPGYWKTNGPDAILLVKTLHDPNDTRLTIDKTRIEVVSQYGDLLARWGERRFGDNWEKIVKNYLLWKAGKPRKMCFDFGLCSFVFAFPNL